MIIDVPNIKTKRLRKIMRNGRSRMGYSLVQNVVPTSRKRLDVIISRVEIVRHIFAGSVWRFLKALGPFMST
jgi:hypothetical protein